MVQEFKIKVPASSSNLGPGFDCFGLALELYNEYNFQITKGKESNFEFSSNLDSSKIPNSKENLLYKSFSYLFDKDSATIPNLTVKLDAQIPTNGGLGSSSTAVVAGLMAANKILEDKYSKDELLNFATELDGHPDNVCAAIFGDFILAIRESSKVIYKKLPWELELDLIAVIPELEISTKEARKVLPKEVKLQDAVKNLSYSSLLVAAVSTRDLDLLSKSFKDTLHQEQRLNLIKGGACALEIANKSGALASFISGSGSTLIALSQDKSQSQDIAKAICESFKKNSVESSSKILKVSKSGAVFN